MHEVCFSIMCPEYQTQSPGLRIWENQVLESDLETVESHASLVELMVQVVAAPRHRAHRNADRLGPRNAP